MTLQVSLHTVIGISASVFSTLSMLPQLFKIVKDKKAGTISVWMLCILFIGLGLWVYYGYLANDPIIIIANSVSLVINIFIIIFSLKYKSKEKS
ncbi:MAG: hypothetical protein H7Y01_05780 [Ferruginibacter sp.]|nr:hypothetical protein [Chitinophagaceae bacterium]